MKVLPNNWDDGGLRGCVGFTNVGPSSLFKVEKSSPDCDIIDVVHPVWRINPTVEGKFSDECVHVDVWSSLRYLKKLNVCLSMKHFSQRSWSLVELLILCRVNSLLFNDIKNNQMYVEWGGGLTNYYWEWKCWTRTLSFLSDTILQRFHRWSNIR